jgi:hypothetical protein
MIRPLLLLLVLVSCSDRARTVEQAQPTEAEKTADEGWRGARADAPAPVAAPMGGAAQEAGLLGASGEFDGRFSDAERSEDKGGGPGAVEEPAAAAQARSWFPESFLWAPEVQTGADGTLSVPVQVPDSLTTWRVLGLAWTAGGAQAGGATTVLSTLPAYVDVAVPDSLYAGDVLELPVQVMNTTSGSMRESLTVEVSGATGGAAGALDTPAGGSATRLVRVDAARPGTVAVSATFGAVDRVDRSFPVRPGGERDTTRGSGAVGGPATEVAAGGALPGGEIHVVVWSGAASVIRDELGGGVRPFEGAPRFADDPLDDAAYRFALALEAAKLPREDADPARVRELRLRAWQPLSRAGRVPDPATACLLAEALRGAAPDTLEGALAERMIDTVRESQAPDGTWLVGAGNVDGTLAAVAACARAAGEDDGVRLRAEGAFARNLVRLDDPWLAAGALASGSVTDEALRARLRDTVTGALTRDNDGAHLAANGALHADGRRVSDAEATAMAALALADDADLAASLATGLLAERHPWGGWGSGRASLLALRALRAAFGDRPASGDVELLVDGTVVARGAVGLDAHAPVLLRAPWSGAAARVEVRAATPSPGLVYTWAANSYRPWRAAPSTVAELSVRAPSRLRVGDAGAMGIAVATPSTVRGTAVVGLPAGVQVDPAGMDALRDDGAFADWESREGTLVLRELPAGGWAGDLPVVASFGGALSSGASALYVAGADAPEAVALPARWVIASR